MSILIDGIVIIFILLSVFIGYKIGLVKLGIKFISFLVAIAITFILYRPIADLIINYTQIDESIQNVVTENIIKNEHNENLNEEKEISTEGIIEQTKNNILVNIAKPLSYNIIYAGVMLALFIISKIILFFVSAFTEIIEKLPIIHQFNRAGGIMYGIIIGYFITNLILLVISLISQTGINNKLEQEIENTYITKLMYENNLFNIFFIDML